MGYRGADREEIGLQNLTLVVEEKDVELFAVMCRKVGQTPEQWLEAYIKGFADGVRGTPKRNGGGE